MSDIILYVGNEKDLDELKSLLSFYFSHPYLSEDDYVSESKFLREAAVLFYSLTFKK